MRCQPRDHVEGEIAPLEIRIGVEHHRNVDGIGNGAEVGLDLRVFEREIGFENGKDAVGAKAVDSVLACSTASAVDGRGNAGNHRHALVARPRW